jgi:hypothetical protein
MTITIVDGVTVAIPSTEKLEVFDPTATFLGAGRFIYADQHRLHVTNRAAFVEGAVRQCPCDQTATRHPSH